MSIEAQKNVAFWLYQLLTYPEAGEEFCYANTKSPSVLIVFAFLQYSPVQLLPQKARPVTPGRCHLV